MIAVITSKRDAHVEAVTRHLDAVGRAWIRLNTEDLPRNAELAIEPACAAGRLLFRDSERSCELRDLTAVWYRKPDPVDLAHFAIDRASLDYIEAEFNEVLQGFYALLHDRYWINHPLTERLAHRKFLQLKVAHDCGFKTPRSIITNVAENAFAFADRVGGNLAIKSLGAINVTTQHGRDQIQHGMFTRRIGKAELQQHADKIQYMPTLFQEFVTKRAELRITCVGKNVFPCRIDLNNQGIAADDYRFVTKDLPHEAVECPTEIREPIRRYLERFNLNFGCFDIAETPAGEYVFFECNPNGQWLWVEEATGLQIGCAIANELCATRPVPSSRHLIQRHHD